MKILAKQNRELIMINAQNTQNENDAEKIILQVPEQYEDFNKKIVFVTPDGIVWDIITNNEYLIKKAITKYQQVDFYIWLTKEEVDFRSQTKTLKFYHNVDASDEITDEEIGRVNTVINLLEEEITKVENLETEIDGKLEEIDTAIDNINTAIQETENLNLDAEKVGQTTTVTLTKKDGTEKTVHIDDGVDLQFKWEGTSLGIKTAEQEQYTFVDLQGVQGPAGPQGEPFTIKKTYSSVAEMNADFNNMQLGDYVMIASTVEVEDNAKLYTRGKGQWIFITDFSGATGNGIATITKTSTVGLVDTYTITYTNGNTTTFTVTNGEVTREELEEEVDRLSMIYNAFPTTTGEGEEPSINGTAEVPFKEIGLKGNTSQETTTGKNLCNLNVAQNSRVTINSDGTITINGNGGFTLNISKYNFKANTTYYMKWELVSGSVSFWQVFMSPVGNKWSEKNKFTSFTVDSDTESSGIWVHNNSVFTNAVIRIWFSETQSPFEPYTGGNPAPNPDYPYPVNVVTGDNSITISNNDNTQSQTYPINLGSMELCKIGDYQDYFYKSGSKWYLHKEIGKVVLNGTEKWRQSGVASAVHNINLPDMLPVANNNTVYNNGISDQFKNGATYQQLTTGTYSNYYNRMSATNDKYMSFSYEFTTTTASWENWLTTHNLTTYYVLETATNTEITDTTLIEQLDNLEKAYSYDTQTNISQTNQDKPFIISYEAILSLRNVLNDLITRVEVLESEV